MNTFQWSIQRTCEKKLSWESASFKLLNIGFHSDSIPKLINNPVSKKIKKKKRKEKKITKKQNNNTFKSFSSDLKFPHEPILNFYFDQG